VRYTYLIRTSVTQAADGALAVARRAALPSFAANLGYMDKSLKDKVLEANDIVDVIGERVTLTRKGKDFVGLCPFHPDHRPSLSVSPAKQIFKCWSCGAGGDVIRFVQLRERVDFREALEILARRAGLGLRTTLVNPQVAGLREGIRAAVAWASQHFQRNLTSTEGGRRALEYALARGLKRETIARFGLGYAADGWDDLLSAARRAGIRPEVLQQAGLVATNEAGRSYDRFRNRLIFPIKDRGGRPIAFGGRSLGDDQAKYLNSPETPLFSKSRVLYGLDLSRSAIQEQGAAIVVEGYMDAVMLFQAGIEHVVATLGTALTDTHVKLLRPLATRLYLCFDGDEAGVRAADRAVEIALRTQGEVRVVVLPNGQDPADCVLTGGAEAFSAQLSRAADALEFKWQQTLKTLEGRSAVARRQAIERFIQFLAVAVIGGGVDPLGQDLLVGRVGELLGVPPEEVFDLLTHQKQAIRRGTGARQSGGDRSAYEAEISGLPAGLVTTTEALLGLLVGDPTGWHLAGDLLARAAEYSETWQRLYGLLLDVRDEVGEYSMKEVVSRCEDGPLCELVSRARQRAAGLDGCADAFQVLHSRLASELNLLRMSDLRRGLRQDEKADDVRHFQALHEVARGLSSPLAPERRWGLSTST